MDVARWLGCLPELEGVAEKERRGHFLLSPVVLSCSRWCCWQRFEGRWVKEYLVSEACPLLFHKLDPFALTHNHRLLMPPVATNQVFMMDRDLGARSIVKALFIIAVVCATAGPAGPALSAYFGGEKDALVCAVLLFQEKGESWRLGVRVVRRATPLPHQLLLPCRRNGASCERFGC